MSRRWILTTGTLLTLAAGTVVAVMLAKGYTFSPQQGRVVGTGIISATSVPDGASVYIDDHLNTATNATISSLPPRKYTIKIVKEGFIPWQKEVEVKEGVVTEIKASLFPALPTIYPLTYNGVFNPSISPDGAKLIFTVPNQDTQTSRQKGGVWVWTMTNAPISFARGAEPHQIIASTPTLDFTKASIRWSPDSKQVLVTMQESGGVGDAFARNFVLNVDQKTAVTDLRDLTPTIDATLKNWDEDRTAKEAVQVAAIKDLTARKIASESAAIKWSPDETKFIVSGDKKSMQPELSISPSPTTKVSQMGDKLTPSPTITPTPKNGFKVYDLALGVEGTLAQSSNAKVYDLPPALDYIWLPDSRHIILVQENKLEVAEFDGSNVNEIYAGNFNSFSVFAWPDSSRIVIVTSHPTTYASQPNLYGINLK